MAIQKITSGILADGAILAADIADGSITTAKIADGNVTSAKIDTVANTKITGLVTSGQIANVANTQITGSIEATQVGTTVSQLFGMRNRIINGGFDVAQRGNTFTSTSSANDDDTYNLDRWYVLSDGNDAVDITQTTTVPTGAKYSIGLDVETVNKKFGIAQIIENVNCYDAIGGNVTLSFQAKVSATTKLDNVKCAIVAWSGTADTVTSDIISAWEAEGTNPTLIANATYENTPVNLNVTTSFATYSVTATVDTASTSNLILFIWSDVTDTTLGDFLYITNVQLEKGSTATPFERRLYGHELALCQRYFYKANRAQVLYARSWSSGVGTGLWKHLQVMRATPTITLTNFGNIDTISDNNEVFFAMASSATGSERDVNMDMTLTSVSAEL
jgi:hypothetical protein